MTELWVPPHPPRRPKPVPSWRGFFGERARTAVYGWSELAFENWYFKRNILGHTVHVVLKPEWVQRVLLDNAANYEKPRLVKRILSPTIGRGLLTSERELWRAQRKIVAASFTPPAVDALVPLFAEVGQAMANSWDAGHARHGGRGDLGDDAGHRHRSVQRRRAAHDARSDGPYHRGDGGRRRGADPGPARDAADPDHAQGKARARRSAVPAGARSGRSSASGSAAMRPTISSRRMIHALLERFPREEAIELAIDNAATFYLAGHETTANLTSWTLFVLSEQPELQDRSPRKPRPRSMAGADAELPDRLPLLRAVVDETLRLYPPVPRFDREAVAADMLGEHEIRPGDLVSIWPWIIQRHRKLWDNPDAFDPDRFAPGAKRGAAPLPISAVRRGAAHLRRRALLDGRGADDPRDLASATGEFAPVPGRQVRPSGMVTLRQEGGLPLILSRR